MNTLREKLIALPKAELHVHFEGTVSPALLLKLAEKNNVDLNAAVALPGLREPITPPPGLAGGTPRLSDFLDFIGIYLKTTQTIQSADDILLVAEAMLESAATQNIQHIECYFTPTTFALFNIQTNDLFDGLIAAEALAKTKYRIELQWIFDIVRNVSRDGAEALVLARAARKQGVAVHSIGLAGYEAHGSARMFATAFEIARAEGFRTLAHAGETGGAESVRETIEILKPDRIGHGIRALEDRSVVELLVDSQIPIEVSPWSNIALGISTVENHPLAEMIDAGVNVVLAADDPGIFQRDLTDNFVYAAERGISLDTLTKLAARSLSLRHRTQ